MQKKKPYVKDEELWRLIEDAARRRRQNDRQWPEVYRATVQPLAEDDRRWLGRHLEAALDRRLYTRTVLSMALVIVGCWWLAPTPDHRIAEGVTYEEVVAINNLMLKR